MVSVEKELVEVIVSESGEKPADVEYTGRLENRHWIAVKNYNKVDWPDPEPFQEEAQGTRKSTGYCCAGDDRLLVAEYMPKYLFHWEKQSIEWPLRLRVAFYIADAFDYCHTEDRPLYRDLNTHRVLFDEDCDPHLSSFSIHLAYTHPEYLKNGKVSPESVICSFSSILLDLPSGKHIPPIHALDMIRSENLNLLLDSHLEGKLSTGEETGLVGRLNLWCILRWFTYA